MHSLPSGPRYFQQQFRVFQALCFVKYQIVNKAKRVKSSWWTMTCCRGRLTIQAMDGLLPWRFRHPSRGQKTQSHCSPKHFTEEKMHRRKLHLEILKSVLLSPHPLFFSFEVFIFRVVKGNVACLPLFPSNLIVQTKCSVKSSYSDANDSNKLGLGSTHHF